MRVEIITSDLNLIEVERLRTVLSDSWGEDVNIFFNRRGMVFLTDNEVQE